MRTFNVGIVGAGGIARGAHLKAAMALKDEVRVLAIADVAPELAQRVATEFNIPNVFTDYHELLAMPEIEVVIVATPNYLHAPVSIAALKAGKHVLCEKPMATNLHDAREMVEVARRSGKLLTIGLQNRFRPDVQFLKQAVDQGQLGEIYHSKCMWLRRRGVPGVGSWFGQKALSGGGPLIDLGVHMIDLNLWLMDYPKLASVSGQTYTKLANQRGVSVEGGVTVKPQTGEAVYDVEDMATAFIRFENRATMTVDVSWATHILERDRITNQFFGTRAGALMEVISLTNVAARVKDELTIYTQEFGESIDIRPQFPVNAPNPSVVQLRSFLHAIETGTEPVVKPEQALQVQEVLAALYESSETGREVRMDQAGS